MRGSPRPRSPRSVDHQRRVGIALDWRGPPSAKWLLLVQEIRYGPITLVRRSLMQRIWFVDGVVTRVESLGYGH